uniref:Phosphatidylinositol 4,5-bisphosphate 5-phosphatase A n=1 Tax=Scleropages formosus TaxID=113540 RepID=A0A8C9SRB3_SCLFO
MEPAGPTRPVTLIPTSGRPTPLKVQNPAPGRDEHRAKASSTPATTGRVGRPKLSMPGAHYTPTSPVSVTMPPVPVDMPSSLLAPGHKGLENSTSRSPAPIKVGPACGPVSTLSPTIPSATLSPQPREIQPSCGSAEVRPQNSASDKKVEDFRVHIVTWNVGSAVPPDGITSLLELNSADGNADMYIIGLQEMNSMINKRLKDVLFTDQWTELYMDTLSPRGYVLVSKGRMQGVLLLVFSRYSHLPFLREIHTESTRTGLGGYWGNKGGVSARMTVFGHSVCFLNCHLPAHMQNLGQRVEDFESILQQQQFQCGGGMGVLDHDLVFWFGDLNFRIEDYDTHVVKSAIESNRLSMLWEKDQLNMAKQSEPTLRGFEEGPLIFPPTYKFDVGTHTYDTSAKKRKPAWTDRILWRLRATCSPGPTHLPTVRRGLTSWLSHGLRVTQHTYRSHMGYTISDHKPVSATFTLQFPFKVDIPLVTLSVDKEWSKVSDASVSFQVVSSFARNSWDWIGLYKVGFRHAKDYVAYVWARLEESDHLVIFAEEDLPKGCGEYILGYFSNSMNTIVGLTEPFQVQLPSCSPLVSRSGSSSSSSEDDSTLGLLPSQSRSPSPASSKQHRPSRSRSPALPTLQGLSLRPRPRSREAIPRSPSPCASASRKERLISPDSPMSGQTRSRTPGTPGTPGIEVSTPEALIAAIIGDHIPLQGSLYGAKPVGEPRDATL